MKKLIVLCIIVSILSLNAGLYAKERHGVELTVVTKDGKEIRGELIAVKKDALLLMGYVSASDITISIDDIKLVKTMEKKSYVAGGALAGGAIGAGVFTLLMLGSDSSGTSVAGWILYGGAFAAAGALAGGLLAALLEVFASGGKTYQFEGRESATVKVYLEELRKKARVKNFQ